MQIETLEKIRVPAGVRLLLDDEQLDARRHNVVIDEDGVALVVKPMEFKVGELLEVVGELPIVIHSSQYRVLDDVGQDVGDEEKKPAKTPKASKERVDSDADMAGDKNDADGTMEFKVGELLEVVGELPIVIHSSQYRVLDDVGQDVGDEEKKPAKTPKASKERVDSDADMAGDKNDADGTNVANSGDDASGADKTGEV